MAHDRQAESNNELKIVSKQLKGRSEVVADWLTLYAATFREEITEEMALLYQQTLKDLRPELLHKAFLLAAKRSKFRPTPAEVREAATVEAERIPNSGRSHEECVVCRGTGWKIVPRLDGLGEWAVKCEGI
jgi:hypothetical protein